MDILSKTFQKFNEKEYGEVFKNCLFVFDTNVILDLYRLPTESSQELQRILADENINKRIWLPFQAYLEFHHGRLAEIKKQRETFTTVESIFKEKIAQLEGFNKSLEKELDGLNLKKKHSIIKAEDFKLEVDFSKEITNLKEFIKNIEKLREVPPDLEKDDTLLPKILKLFEDKIGVPFSKAEIEDIYREGEIRYENNIPPGYEDAKKKKFNEKKPEDYSYRYNDAAYIREYGDLVMWKELLRKARDERWRYVIFVCNENKPDWWEKNGGEKIKPRYELLNEIYSAAPTVEFFHIYEVHQFMKYIDQTYKEFKITKESIEAAKEISLFSRTVDRNSRLDNVEDFKKRGNLVGLLVFALDMTLKDLNDSYHINYEISGLPMFRKMSQRSRLETMLVELFSFLQMSPIDLYFGESLSSIHISIYFKQNNQYSTEFIEYSISQQISKDSVLNKLFLGFNVRITDENEVRVDFRLAKSNFRIVSGNIKYGSQVFISEGRFMQSNAYPLGIDPNEEVSDYD